MTLSDNIKVLLVEDNIGDYILVSEYLKMVLPNSKLTHNKTLAAALKSLENDYFNIILLDLSLPDSNGKDSITEIISLSAYTPVLVLTGYTNKEFGIETLKLGVQDYLIKDEVTPAILHKAISYSMERKKNQYELEQSEKRFRALIENSTDGMMLLRTDGTIIDITPTAQKIIGRCTGTGKIMLYELIAPADEERVRKSFAQVCMEPGQIAKITFRLLQRDGGFCWIDAVFHNLFEEPAVNAVVLNFTDISDQKKAANLLQESEEKYRYLFNKNPEAIFVWDPATFSILDYNETCLQLHSYTATEMQGMSLFDILIPDDHEVIRTIAYKLQTGAINTYERLWMHIKKNGDKLFMNMNAHSVVVNGKLAILCIGNNVTEKLLLEKELEDEKTKRQKEITEAVLKAQENERDEIGSELHDNVCQILASAKLYMGMLKKQPGSVMEIADEAEKLISSAIEELRLLSHALISPVLERSSLRQSIEKIADLIKRTTSIKVSHQFIDLNETLLNADMRLVVYRIVQEQFNNIIKHAKAKNIKLLLSVSNEYLHLQINDDGIGFDVGRIAGGVGLLNINTRAALFNGKVSVTSQPGAGTSLQVLLPLYSS
jgi:PAS domain S-box-containing protein